MDRTIHLNNAGTRAEVVNGHDLERQLALAEQRYATARAALDTARSELRELASRKDASEQILKEARARHEAVALRTRRLRSLIDRLEERLDL